MNVYVFGVMSVFVSGMVCFGVNLDFVLLNSVVNFEVILVNYVRRWLCYCKED